MRGKKATWRCVICDKPSTGHGNNPEPVRQMQEGQCCDVCDRTQVWPARQESLRWMTRDQAITADFDGYFDRKEG